MHANETFKKVVNSEITYSFNKETRNLPHQQVGIVNIRVWTQQPGAPFGPKNAPSQEFAQVCVLWLNGGAFLFHLI